MARLQINDLPQLSEMTPEQLKELFGAGRFRPQFEALEERLLLAGDIDLKDGVLTIEGDQYQDVADVRVVGDEIEVDLYSAEKSGVTIDVNNPRNGRDIEHADKSYDIDEVHQIVFRGFAGDDTFRNDSAIPSRAEGGAGDDFLRGGGGNDELYGRDGNDVLEGGAGDDELHGGRDDDTYVFSNLTNFHLGTDQIWEDSDASDFWAGNDALDFSQMVDNVGVNQGLDLDLGYYGVQAANAQNVFRSFDLQLDLGKARNAIENVMGTNMNDRIAGNDQVNYLFGGAGNDYLYGKGGDDYLYGGGGRDRLWGDTGRDFLYGDSGNDYLYGGRDADVLFGGTGADYLDGNFGSNNARPDYARDVLFGNDAANTDDHARDTFAWNWLRSQRTGGIILFDVIAGISSGDAVSQRNFYL